ncbi:MAG: PD-(D/E)XK nuclease family protein [Candidatus Peribacteraceae bacterium]|nr:PD-(D/E)XK nuclease family protein [Candidatus Peribacteraceae bacterium]
MILKKFGFKPLPIEFSEKGHTYRLDGFRLTGTTSIIGTKNKVWMGPWAAKETARFLGYYDKLINSVKISKAQEEELKKILEIRLNEIKELTPAKFYQLLHKSKNARNDKSKPALVTGKLVHNDLIQTSIEKGVRYKVENIKHENEQIQYEVRNCYQAWLNWEKEHVVEYLATELIVAVRELFLAGTIDVIAIVDGVLMLGDFKTSKQISSDVFIQTAIYKYMLIKSGITQPIKRFVLRLDKGTTTNNQRVEGFKPTHEYLIIPSDYSKDLKCFMGLYSAYHWNSYQDKNNFLKKKRFYKSRK